MAGALKRLPLPGARGVTNCLRPFFLSCPVVAAGANLQQQQRQQQGQRACGVRQAAGQLAQGGCNRKS